MSTNFRPLGSQARPGGPAVPDRYFELKSDIHKQLISVLNDEQLAELPKERMRAEVGRIVERLLEEERVPMNTAEFVRSGVSDSGKVLGRFEWSGHTPRILDRLKISGISLPEDIFHEVVEIA